MSPGEARHGDFVYFALGRAHGRADDPPLRIARGQVENVIWPGTTNEYFSVKVVYPDNVTLTLTMYPRQCFRTGDEARRSATANLHAQMEDLRAQLASLGDHSATATRWNP